MKDFVCCLDLGTSRIKAGLVDARGGIAAAAELDAPPASQWRGFHSFDPEAYAAESFRAVAAAVKAPEARGARIRAVTVTSQRATVVPLHADGRPAGPALSWQDTSAGPQMTAFVSRVGRRRFVETTGLPPSALWSLGRILRWREVDPAGFEAGAAFPLLHDFVLLRLGAPRAVTDPSNASVTGLMCLARRGWDPHLLAAAGLTPQRLPQIRPAGSPAGAVSAAAAKAAGLPPGIPLVVGGGDQQCAALGAGVLDPGAAAVCVGTAAVVSCPTDRPAPDPDGKFFCTAHAAADRWVAEGIHNAFASSLRWTGSLLGCGSPADFDALVAASTPGSAGAVFLPFLAGVGTPDYDAAASGSFLGLREHVRPGDLARAALEGACFELRRILDAIASRANTDRLVVSGGGLPGRESEKAFAAIVGRPVAFIRDPSTSLHGAAALAWTGAGRFTDVRAATREVSRAPDRELRPGPESGAYRELYRQYCRLVSNSRRPPPAGTGGDASE